MSYSFSIKADTKEGAMAATAQRLDEIIANGQPLHTRDRQAALDNLDKHLALLSEPKEGEEVTAGLYGSITVSTQTVADTSVERVTSCGSGCNVNVGNKPVHA